MKKKWRIRPVIEDEKVETKYVVDRRKLFSWKPEGVYFKYGWDSILVKPHTFDSIELAKKYIHNKMTNPSTNMVKGMFIVEYE